MSEPSVPWVPTHDDVVETVVKLIRPLKNDTIYELGCGDGRVAAAIAAAHKVKVVCIEIREDLVKRAKRTIVERKVSDYVTVLRGDFFTLNLSKADIVYMYLLTSVNQKLRPKLERELPRGSLIISLDFPIPGWTPLGYLEMNRSWQRMLYVYAKGFSDEGVVEGVEKALARLNKSMLTYINKELLGLL